jgi:Protein of unknown function (DUF1091)
MNGTVEDAMITSYADFLVDVPAPIKVLLTLKHFSNGAYVRSFMNIEVEICGFLRTTDQNLVLRKIYEFMRSYGKIPNRCPLRRVRLKIAVFSNLHNL